MPDSLDDYILPHESIFIQDIYAIGCQEGTPFRYITFYNSSMIYEQHEPPYSVLDIVDLNHLLALIKKQHHRRVYSFILPKRVIKLHFTWQNQDFVLLYKNKRLQILKSHG